MSPSIRLFALAGLCGAVWATACRPVAAQQADLKAATEAGVETLTRGPVHEAFATPVEADPVPGLVVEQPPPEPIEELPPEVHPEGAVWIPGYWAWDEDRGFLWVSGVWRIPPPDHEWISGYWTKVEGGYEWVPGFWKPMSVDEVVYYPEPPESIEEGPTSPPPSADHVWVPGCWIWYETRYVWRPGYWITPQPDWVWVNACYLWTPSGYVFVDGYWDYVPYRRGLLFAPVYFETPIYARAGYVYTPTVSIDLELLSAHLFVWPSYYHYYFGDYYATRYTDVGIYPWYSYHERNIGYDPIYAYYDWYYRSRGLDWSARMDAWFTYVSEHEDYRPPHTFAEQRRLAEGRSRDETKGLLLAQAVSDLTADQQRELRLERLSQQRRSQFARIEQNVRELRRQRAQAEAQAAAEGPPGEQRAARPRRSRLPSDGVTRRSEQLQGEERRGAVRAPARPEAPQPDRSITPKQGRPHREDAGRPQVPSERPVRPMPPGLEGKQPDRRPPSPRRPQTPDERRRVPPQRPEPRRARPGQPQTPPEHRRIEPVRPNRAGPPERPPQPPRVGPDRSPGPQQRQPSGHEAPSGRPGRPGIAPGQPSTDRPRSDRPR